MDRTDICVIRPFAGLPAAMVAAPSLRRLCLVRFLRTVSRNTTEAAMLKYHGSIGHGMGDAIW